MIKMMTNKKMMVVMMMMMMMMMIMTIRPKVAWRRIDADDFLTIGKMTWIEDENFAIDFSDKGNDITKLEPRYR
nr:hypothetical protein BaRGS_006263 [Batillaria attramentaria]